MRSWLSKTQRRMITIVLSLAWLIAGGLLLELGIAVLSPVGVRNLAMSAWLLALLLILSSTLAVLLWFQLMDYKKHYPDHEKDQEYEKHFNEFADKKAKG